MGIRRPFAGWRISPSLDPLVQVWPDGGVVFSRASGDTHWVPEAGCLILQELRLASLSHEQLRLRLATRLSLSADDSDLNSILETACEMLSEAALIEPAV
jgi:PqqD family protein of HPr-rel-A system